MSGTIVEHRKQKGHQEGEASAYHQLGMIAQEQRDFSQAGEWYRKSLVIEEKLGDEYDAAKTYHQLGRDESTEEHLA
ncbi:MAG: tetratricopeptide repeat protein [Pseudomonadota bacterium]|nr:tetratricopeptide repeat protein [Pseudomonadota bacterium]